MVYDRVKGMKKLILAYVPVNVGVSLGGWIPFRSHSAVFARMSILHLAN